MECGLVTTRNEVLIRAMICVVLENILLGGRSQ